MGTVSKLRKSQIFWEYWKCPFIPLFTGIIQKRTKQFIEFSTFILLLVPTIILLYDIALLPTSGFI